MKRRTLLGTLAATAFAGCTGYASNFGGDDDTTTDETTTDRTTTTDGGGDFPLLLADVRTDDPPVPDVTIDVTVERSFTREQPATLTVAFTNDADEAREFAFGSLVPWDGLWGEHEDGAGTLLLAPSGGVVPEEPDGDCWQATDGIALPAVMRTETLDPDQTVSTTFDVLATHDSETCLEPGTYRFEKENYLDGGWGFSVDIVEQADD